MEETDVEAQPGEGAVRFEIEHLDDYARYLLHAKAEVVAVLRSLIQKRSLISAYFNNGRFFMLTSLLRVDVEAGEVVFECGREERINRLALLAEQVLMTTTVDQIKVQFVVGKLAETQSGGLPAFSAELPGQVLRLQRREYYRLSTPLTKPVKFVARIRRADGSALIVEASLLDLSGGGICLMVTPQMAELLQRGDILTECKMTLPDEGQLVASLYIRNKLEVATRGGSRYLRVGCQFLDLPGARMSMVQRYINRVERERKARLSGMA
jgi:c-di-GMP-binding flagellar brake protein YcgR